MNAPWITEATKYIGLSEVPGNEHEPKILKFWRTIKMGGIKTDEVPWCAAFCGAMLEAAGIRSPRADNAKAFLSWGVRVPYPVYGCIAVFSRKGGGGHVGFVIGEDQKGRLMILGGNQSDKVSIAPFDRLRLMGYRMPPDYLTLVDPIPLIANNAESSSNEA